MSYADVRVRSFVRYVPSVAQIGRFKPPIPPASRKTCRADDMLTTNDIPGGRPRRILLIEGSELDRQWLRVRLSSDSVHVFEAADGAKGLEFCRDDPPDLVLLDLGLPHGEGFNVLRRLKDDPRTDHVPVVVVSTPARGADVVRGLDGGAVDFVNRPYDLVELRARIRAALRTRWLQEMLEERAHVDGLTGLANRHALEERLATEWGMVQRHGGSLAVWIADLDNFKRVNDRHGRAAGDEVLRRVTTALRSTVRSTDLVARYGGEEFVVVAPHCRLTGAIKTAERFRDRLSASTVVFDRGPGSTVTVSVGVAAFPENPVDSPAELLARADRALCRAKIEGRNRVFGAAPPEPVEALHDGWILAQARG